MDHLSFAQAYMLISMLAGTSVMVGLVHAMMVTFLGAPKARLGATSLPMSRYNHEII